LDFTQFFCFSQNKFLKEHKAAQLNSTQLNSTTMSESAKPLCVLAYSGGLDTSVILKWLIEKGFDVIAFCANVGQFEEDFSKIQAKAVNCGALKCIVTDLRADFVENYVFEAVKCNAIYESRYLLGTSIARPCIAKEMIRIAIEEGAKYVAHGATGKGNDQVRFEMCAQALCPTITTVAPWRDAEFIESFKGRTDLLAYCTKHGIPVDAKPKANYSVDENLYHTSCKFTHCHCFSLFLSLPSCPLTQPLLSTRTL
jgi:argininosuccinate synthase